MKHSNISVLIVTYNSEDEILNCLQSIKARDFSGNLELIVVDNNSSDDTVHRIESSSDNIRLLKNTWNKGFAKACNQGIEASDSEFVFLVNPDSILDAGCLERAVARMNTDPQIGILGGKLINTDQSEAPSARSFPTLIRKIQQYFNQPDLMEIKAAQSGDMMEVEWVPGAFTCIRREMLNEIGLFDDRFFLYYEETDLCKRARNSGWKVVYDPACHIQHIGGASSVSLEEESFSDSGSQLTRFRLYSECLYHRKHGGLAAVLGTLGFECCWQMVRAIRYLPRKSRPVIKDKYEDATDTIRIILRTLSDTKNGKLSPCKPW
ncbi:MAG: glycosyltransferase family 2 protein [Opitutales bacterium]|nr:glycosyltransferase family 2 protein [Opitutales bacterium]